MDWLWVLACKKDKTKNKYMVTINFIQIFNFLRGSMYSLIGKKLQRRIVTRGTWLKHPPNSVLSFGHSNFNQWCRLYNSTLLLNPNGQKIHCNLTSTSHRKSIFNWSLEIWLEISHFVFAQPFEVLIMHLYWVMCNYYVRSKNEHTTRHVFKKDWSK